MNAFTTSTDAVRTGAGEVRDRVGDSLHRAKDRIELPVHRHPLETILFSAGSGILMGFVIGLLVGRRGADR